MENRKLNKKFFNWFQPKIDSGPAQKRKAARLPSPRTNIKATEAWAGFLSAHLGWIEPKQLIPARPKKENDLSPSLPHEN
jgi:hypothetical protein